MNNYYHSKTKDFSSVYLFARGDTFDIVGTTVQDLDEIVVGVLDASLHWWNAFGIAFHSMGGNTESELHPALSTFQLVLSSCHTSVLDVQTLFGKVILFFNW